MQYLFVIYNLSMKHNKILWPCYSYTSYNLISWFSYMYSCIYYSINFMFYYNFLMCYSSLNAWKFNWNIMNINTYNNFSINCYSFYENFMFNWWSKFKSFFNMNYWTSMMLNSSMFFIWSFCSIRSMFIKKMNKTKWTNYYYWFLIPFLKLNYMILMMVIYMLTTTYMLMNMYILKMMFIYMLMNKKFIQLLVIHILMKLKMNLLVI
nr:cytochrome c oxidase subunit 2 [Megacampsomeris sp. 1 YJY-2023a]